MQNIKYIAAIRRQSEWHLFILKLMFLFCHMMWHEMIHFVSIFVQLADVANNLISSITRFFNPDYKNVVHECSLGLEMPSKVGFDILASIFWNIWEKCPHNKFYFICNLKLGILYNNNDDNNNYIYIYMFLFLWVYWLYKYHIYL